MSSSRPGSLVIVQKVRPGREEEYRAWSRQINTACSQAPGFVDLEVFEPVAGQETNFVIVVRFRSDEEGQAWHTSPTCQALLEQARPLMLQTTMHQPSSVFGGWFSGSDGSVSRWKDALTVLLVLYPTVMLLTLYVTGPLLKGWSMATSMYIGNVLSVILLTWLLMPAVTSMLKFWLNPRPGDTSGWLGLPLVLGGQLSLVALFRFLEGL